MYGTSFSIFVSCATFVESRRRIGLGNMATDGVGQLFFSARQKATTSRVTSIAMNLPLIINRPSFIKNIWRRILSGFKHPRYLLIRNIIKQTMLGRSIHRHARRNNFPIRRVFCSAPKDRTVSAAIPLGMGVATGKVPTNVSVYSNVAMCVYFS